MKTENTIQVLTVERQRKSAYCITTILRDDKGKVKTTFQSMLNQPHKNCKTIILKGILYSLNWNKAVCLTLGLVVGMGCNGGFL